MRFYFIDLMYCLTQCSMGISVYIAVHSENLVHMQCKEDRKHFVLTMALLLLALLFESTQKTQKAHGRDT